ncbi:MAG: hypothetical protein KGL68_12190 [Burkholderiales bacterium]|nr:hypothetical protein [Burkholderiales bacterium]
MNHKPSARAGSDRVLGELLHAAADLSRHGLLSREDMLQVRAQCEPPESSTHPTGAAARLLQVIEKKGVEAILAG